MRKTLESTRYVSTKLFNAPFYILDIFFESYVCNIKFTLYEVQGM